MQHGKRSPGQPGPQMRLDHRAGLKHERCAIVLLEHRMGCLCQTGKPTTWQSSSQLLTTKKVLRSLI